MNSFDGLLNGGESEVAANIPGKPDERYLVELITPVDGQAEMPKGKKPLSGIDIQLVRQWIEEGARDDTPVHARQQYDSKNLPTYTQPPIITSLDYSPDGSLLAIAGFHEVLLTNKDDSMLEACLIGMSERIESVRFSSDGSRLLVTGGRLAPVKFKSGTSLHVNSCFLCQSHMTQFTGKVGRRTVSGLPSAARTTPCGPLILKLANRSCFRLRTTIECLIHSSPTKART